MAIQLPAIVQRIRVDDSDLDSSVGRVEGRFSKLGSVMGTAVKVGAAAAATGIAAFAASGVKGAVKVDQGLREVNTLFGLTGDAAEESFGQLQDGVAELSGEVGVAQEAITGGLYQAISAGVPRDNAFEFMRIASEASIAGVTDVETAVDGMSSTINAFGLEADDAQAVADSMFAAVAGGKTTFEELSASMSNVAPAAAAAGVEFTEVNAAIATLTAGGAPTAQATTQIRAALVGLQKPSEEMTAIFQEAGYESAAMALESEGLATALDIVSDAADGDAGKLQTLLGSVEAVGAAQVLAGTGADKMAEELERQENSAGAATAAFEEMEKSTSRQFARLTNTIKNAAIALGAALLPAINRGIGVAITMAGSIGKVVGVFQRFSGVARVLGAILAVVFGPALIARFAATAAAAVTSAATQIAAWTTTKVQAIASVAAQTLAMARTVAGWVVMGTQSLANAARVAAAWLIAMGPIPLIIAAVVGLVVLIVKNWETIKRVTLNVFRAIARFLTRTWEAITGALSKAWDAITSAVSRAWDAVKGAITGALSAVRSFVVGWVSWYLGLWASLWRTVTGALRSAWSTITGLVSGAVSRLIGFVTNLWRRWVSIVQTVRSTIVSVIRNAWDRVRDAVSSGVSAVITHVAGIPGRMLSALGNLGSLLYNAGRSVLEGMVRGLKSMAGTLARAALKPVTDAVDKVKGFLRIGSPSRLWMGMGEDTGKGFALGLEDQRTNAARSAKALAAAATGAFDPSLEWATGRAAGRVGAGWSTRPSPATAQPAAGATQTVHIDKVESRDPHEAARELDSELGWQFRKLAGTRG